MAKTLAEKLLIKPGRTVRFLHAPADYAAILGDLPPGITVLDASASPSAPADVVQLFVKSRAELETHLPGMKAALAPDGILWVCYFKGTAKHPENISRDVNRDTLHAYGQTLGLQGVSMISVDGDWSAMRFKILA